MLEDCQHAAILTQRSLVIGSSSLLGKALIHQLRQQGSSFSVCNRQRIEEYLEPQYQIEDLEKINDDFEVVYLLAAHVPYSNLARFSRNLVSANISLVQRVSDRFPRSRIVFSSSVSVYGVPLHLSVDECHPFNQPNAYGLSKIAGETILQAHDSSCILRFSSLYGPGMQVRSFLPLIVQQAIQSNKISLHGDYKRLQNYLSVADAAKMLSIAATSRKNAVVNAVGQRSHSNRDVAEIVARYVGNTTITLSERDSIPIPSFQYSSDRWLQLFGYGTQVSIENGIRDLVDDTSSK